MREGSVAEEGQWLNREKRNERQSTLEPGSHSDEHDISTPFFLRHRLLALSSQLTLPTSSNTR